MPIALDQDRTLRKLQLSDIEETQESEDEQQFGSAMRAGDAAALGEAFGAAYVVSLLLRMGPDCHFP